MIPVLDLDKIQRETKPRRQPQNNNFLTNPLAVKTADHAADHDAPVSTSRSIFTRNTFRDFMEKMGVSSPEDFNVENYPEMLKIREKAILYRQKTEEKYINKMLRQNQISPRTHNMKHKELEIWVSNEQAEVKETKKVFEAEWQKTAKIMNHA